MKNRWSLHRSSWSGNEYGCDACRQNPARGFYHVYTYDLTEEEVEEDWIWSLQKDERLVLVLLDIGKCAERDLSDGELAKAARIFSFFKENGRQMILRVVYDREGRGMEREPRDIGQVCAHMRQLGPVFAQFSADILTVQGLFIGSWGEMHDSRYLERPQLLSLHETLWQATGGSVCISVRKPQYQRILESAVGGVCTGLYDDAILGSDTDMGTFGWIDDDTDPQIMWTPRLELPFIRQQAARLPIGGEVLAGALGVPWEDVIERMRLMQLTYLNRVHEPALWQAWEHMDCEVQPDVTRMDYLRSCLGYRYVLLEVILTQDVARGERICVTVKNTGFACCYDPLRMVLRVGKRRLQTVFDGKTLAAGAVKKIVFDVREALAVQESSAPLVVRLALYHEKTGLPIYFSNDFTEARRYERYRSNSSLESGSEVGILLTEKDATS